MYFTRLGGRGMWPAELLGVACWSGLTAVPLSWWLRPPLNVMIPAKWLAAPVLSPHALWGYLAHHSLTDEGTNLPPSLPPSFPFSFLSYFHFVCFSKPTVLVAHFYFSLFFLKLCLWEYLFWCTRLLLMLTEMYDYRYLSVFVNLIIWMKPPLVIISMILD